MEIKLSKEGWTAILTQVVAALTWIAGMFVPPEYQEAATYIIAAIEAIGLALILLFVRETQKRITALQAEVKSLQQRH